jgi:large subunit ribosomal protein L29
MAKTKVSELRDMSVSELAERLTETKEELFNLRFQNATGQLDNYKRLAVLRKEVARIKTIQRQKEIEEIEGGNE